MLADGLKALGANVDPLPLPDVTQALQNGTIDGVEANLPLIYTQQWYEQAKYVTGNVNLWPFPTVLVINKAVWDGLSADQQNALTTAAAATSGPRRSKIFTTPGSTVAQDLVNCGVKYLYATDADKTQLTNAAKTAIQSSGPREPGLRHPDPGPARPCRPRRPRRPSPRPRPGSASHPRGRLALTPARTGDDRDHADPAPRGPGRSLSEALLGQAR